MKVIECRGTHREIGRTMGEALRDEIRSHVERFLPPIDDGQRRALALFKRVTERYCPDVTEQFAGLAAGAAVAEEVILGLNYPSLLHDPHLEQGCSNLVIKDGPDGPLWGKNNEGTSPNEAGRRPIAAVKLYPRDGIPAVAVTFCGWLNGLDMINAEGVAIGHSSVGSRLQQSPHHAPLLQYVYSGMMKVRNIPELARHLTAVPLRGKGFAAVALDRQGNMCAPELVCPLAQLRWPEPSDPAMHCVNCYQLPTLRNLTNRTPEQLENAQGRHRMLLSALREGSRDVEHVKSILRHHGPYSLCRHGNRDMSYTEWSVIAQVAENRLWVLQGYPCQEEYRPISL